MKVGEGENSVTLTQSSNQFVANGNTFTVKTSNRKIGSIGTLDTDYAVKEWQGSPFTYTTDGAFYTISLTSENNTLVEFATVFENFSIQTEGSNNVQEYSQQSTGRTGSDFGAPGANHTGTKIYTNGSNEVGTLYYGLHSEIFGVNFGENATATINLKGDLKTGAPTGNYKITVTMYDKVRKSKDVKFTDKTELDSNSNVLGTVTYNLSVTE